MSDREMLVHVYKGLCEGKRVGRLRAAVEALLLELEAQFKLRANSALRRA